MMLVKSPMGINTYRMWNKRGYHLVGTKNDMFWFSHDPIVDQPETQGTFLFLVKSPMRVSEFDRLIRLGYGFKGLIDNHHDRITYFKFGRPIKLRYP